MTVKIYLAEGLDGARKLESMKTTQYSLSIHTHTHTHTLMINYIYIHILMNVLEVKQT